MDQLAEALAPIARLVDSAAALHAVRPEAGLKHGPQCTLLVFIDDATSRLMHLQFVQSESTFAYVNATQQYLEQHGKPVAFYTDKHAVFRVNKPSGLHGEGMTQFGRALKALSNVRAREAVFVAVSSARPPSNNLCGFAFSAATPCGSLAVATVPGGRSSSRWGQHMSKVASELRTSKEKTYGLMMSVFGALLWVMIVWGVWAALNGDNAQVKALVDVYGGYAVLIALFVWISGLAYRATAFGNMILLGPKQFPDLYGMVTAGAEELGMKSAPKVFLYNSNGLMNAFARRLFGGDYVFLTSALIEADNDEQVRFVIGHELGHHAAGHLNPWMNFVKLPGYLVPFLRPAYSRAREYTCDRIGFRLSKDLAASRSSLQMLGCGCRRLNQSMNCEAFMMQEAMVPPIFGFLTEIFRSHPRLTRRVAALREH